ncbi:MAG: 1-deoxy-D-xylulose-5-phosphate synthase [Deltaproteobacteria bacterium]|nr:1-deoxy-D-xylulose-5-phosphate synthase [Deltaproteobacteria bacterium]
MNTLLELIKSPADLKKLSLAEMSALAAEIRALMIKVVSQNGGHLASSLGAVELIIALHYVFNSPDDQIIFDVGHQAYAHKLLTGRTEEFTGLRQLGGLSGFPKREESPHDIFNTGHSSTSISAALGLAVARDQLKKTNAVVAVIGDGALTGGMALEAINHAGGLQKNLLVVYNDNRMSISPNVGALSQYLSLKLTTQEHIVLRERVKNILERISPQKGNRLIKRFQRAEESLKSFLISPTSFLAAWGFKYIGPIDGHDLNRLINALKQVQNLKRPVILHVLTTKGKGFQPAEDNPMAFHGVGRSKAQPPPRVLDLNHVAPKASESDKRSYTDVFGDFLIEAAKEDNRINAITAAMSQGTGLDRFFELFPERSFDVGIAEQHAVTFAAGLAAGGLKPVVAIYSTFLQRSFDQLFHDVALQNLPVAFAVDRGGLVGEDGPTHHGGLDLSYLRLLPNFTVMAPRDEHELARMLALALTLEGPSAVRYPRGTISGRPDCQETPLEVGQAEVMREGQDLAILAIGHPLWAAIDAAESLKAKGLEATVINMRFIKPIDRQAIEKAAQTGKIITVEENSVLGGLNGAVCEILGQLDLKGPVKVKALGLGDLPIAQASPAQQRASLSLDAQGVEKAALAFFPQPRTIV